MDATTRLVFLALISLADDAGRLVDSVKQLDGEIFAYTSESCRRSLDDLSANGRIRRGVTASGQKVIQLTNWRHQKIDKPNLLCALPPIVDESTIDRRLIVDASAPLSVSVSTIDDLLSTTDDDDQGDPSSASSADQLLASLPTNTVRSAWRAELAGAASGMHGPRLTPEQVEQACRDYIGNGHSTDKPSLRHFRAFLRDAVRPPSTSSPKRSDKITEGRAALAAWVKESEHGK